MKSPACNVAVQHCGTKDTPFSPSALAECGQDEGSGDPPTPVPNGNLQLVVVSSCGGRHAPTSEIAVGVAHEIEPEHTDWIVIEVSNKTYVAVVEPGAVVPVNGK